MRATFWFLAVVLAVMSASASAPVSAEAVPNPPFRLSNDVRPLSYDVAMTIVPTADRFTGKVGIALEIAVATRFFWINSSKLDIRHATLHVGNQSLTARVVPGGSEAVGLRFNQTVPVGRATLTIEYDGSFEHLDSDGVFKLHDLDDWYVYTQFESTSARRAFPCFDDPAWKTPWTLTLEVPTGTSALANTGQTSEEPGTPGMKRAHFATTSPLPSYLIAFAVGPFEIVDGGRAGRRGTPLRYILPKGHPGEARFAVAATPKLLELLEDYFGQPYPFDKLDLVSVPLLVGFGGMENAGFITFSARNMLARPESETELFRENFVRDTAHEISHQWFGDLVTMQWWNDVWLNESFATWISGKITERFNPDWPARTARASDRANAMGTDSLFSTRQIRQPVQDDSDLWGAFDRITYEKGAAVLSMTEQWMGEERFRSGVRRYLTDHSGGSARAEDFYSALAIEAGPDFADATAVLSSMIEQPGLPALHVALECDPAGKVGPRLNLLEERFVADRPAADSEEARSIAAQHWVFPACFQYGEGADFGETCTVVRETQTVLPLPAGEKCPGWVLANQGGSGYFLPILSPALQSGLLSAPILPDEAIPMISDARVTMEGGQLGIDAALAIASRYANNRQPAVAREALRLVAVIPTSFVESASDREAFARYVRRVFGPRAAILGWLPKPGERGADADLRVELLPFVAERGADSGLRREAERLAREWLAGHQSLGDMTFPVLHTAALDGQHELEESFAAAAEKASDPEKHTIYRAMAGFRNPAVLFDAMGTVLSDRLDARDAIAVFTAAAKESASSTEAFQYLRTHYDQIAKRMPELYGSYFIQSGSELCDVDQRRAFATFFAERAAKMSGGPLAYRQVLEKIDGCLQWKDSQNAALAAFLANQP